MKNIVLVCAAGMSTSLLVTKMREAAEARGEQAQIEAYSIAEIKEVVQAADVILLGPQVRYQKETVEKEAGETPVAVIDMIAYGTMDGDKVYDQASDLILSQK